MGDLTNNFSRFEFACECGCGFDCVDFELLTILQKVRDHFNQRVQISGPNRCKSHNATIKGAAKGSFHTRGRAADFRVQKIEPRKVYKFIDQKYPNKLGLILYDDRVHIDTRATKYREIK